MSEKKSVQRIAVLTGAGMSAESGIRTFRDSNGLWEDYDVMKVASIEGYRADPALVQRFYNDRRAQLDAVQPNEGHRILADLEKEYQVTIITQNVDNLHERAGSSVVIHLHGELTKACNEGKTEVVDIGTRAILPGERAGDGTLLRPFIVWFGEAVPLIDVAARAVSEADVLIIVGTSMQVYPAAGLIHYAGAGVPVYLIDPAEVQVSPRVEVIREGAVRGLGVLKGRMGVR
jgi:NAD-dependent deacetylase